MIAPACAQLSICTADPGQDLWRGLGGKCFEFIAGAILDRMLGPHNRRLEPQRAGLGCRCLLKLHGRGGATGDASSVEGVNVMQTARRARASIRERFDDQVSLRYDILQDRLGRRLGVGWLLEADGFDACCLN